MVAKEKRICSTMKISIRCHPALRELLPAPMLAKTALPSWVRDMPSHVDSPVLGAGVRTLKHCPPILDAMGVGITFYLPTDIHVGEDGFTWDWNFPVLTDSLLSRAPIGFHLSEQTTGSPFESDGDLILKFMNFWTVCVPDGYSILFVHPSNRYDLPFQTLSGLVDCDLFKNGYVHFPAVWTNKQFRGTLAKGTPVAQAIVVKRQHLDLEIDVQSDDQIAETRLLQEELSEERGVYRKKFRASHREN